MTDSGTQGLRAIAVTAVDTEGRPVAATISIRLDDLPAGNLQLNENRSQGTIEFPGHFRMVRLDALYMGQKKTVQLDRDDSQFEFKFMPVLLEVAHKAQAGVTCPDGSKGNPCAICDVGGVKVRVCI